MARTIDNLGVELSTRYAEDKEIYDETLVKEARLISSQARITTTQTSYPQEFDTLFDLGAKKALWATFLPPPNYYTYRGRVFSEQLIPELGSPDLQDATLERLELVGDEEKKKHPAPKQSEEIEKEKEVLTNLISNLHLFDQLLIDINSRRAQYQKG